MLWIGWQCVHEVGNRDRNIATTKITVCKGYCEFKMYFKARCVQNRNSSGVQDYITKAVVVHI